MDSLAPYFDSSLLPFLQILVAAVLGMILGVERALARRTAGPRTYGLVSLGSCLLTIIAIRATVYFPAVLPDYIKIDPMPIISAIITGIGFIGAGLIVFRESRVSGLTTAAGIWVAAAIGIAIGFEYYLLAVFTTFLTLFLFSTMWYLENKIKSTFAESDEVEK